MNAPSAAFPRKSLWILFAAVLAAAQGACVLAYCASEHTVYFWDHAMYHGMAQAFWQLALRQPSALGQALRQSMAGSYNYLFTLPSLLTFSLFGPSRLTFIGTNFAFFFLAYEAAVAFTLEKTFGIRRLWAVLLALAACSAMPPLWIPLVEGYPDHAAGAAFVLAVALFLAPFGNLKTAASLGFLLAFAFVLRRHFAYPVLAFCCSAALFSFYETVWLATTKEGGKALQRFIVYFAVLTATLIASMALLAPGLLSAALSTDYNALYLSYKKPALVFLSFAAHRFGLLPMAIAVAGLAMAWRARPSTRRPLMFIGLVTLLTLLLWCHGPCQAGHHYLLHGLPLLFAVGLTGFWLSLADRLRRRPDSKGMWVLGACVAGFLVFNALWALALAPKGVQPDNMGPPGLLSAPLPPEVRQDYDQLTQLANDLAQTTTDQDSLYLVGSSFTFNQDLFAALATHVLHRPDVAARFVFGPEVDSREFSPQEAVAQANVYVVAEPAQYHLTPEGQTVIGAGASLFLPSSPLMPYLDPDPKTYALENGVRVRIWRRKPLPPVTLRTVIETIRKTANVQHPDWICLTPHLQTQESMSAPYSTDILLRLTPERPEATMAFFPPIDSGAYEIHFGAQAEPACQNVSYRLEAVDGHGQRLTYKTFVPTSLPGPVTALFEVHAPSQSQAFLRLEIAANPSMACSTLLQRLTVRPIQGHNEF